ncbi:hypothetical protein DSO57_1006361 [Entomophthora muscae]|uniref:Uncharacterized protein n=1 Tax=Entomophthora muscae TaxID=34485 RepID=A0ACC2SWS4_9FUNG|nr:hypothetical protein DSO57_1006361 [Entomophthora muscae]
MMGRTDLGSAGLYCSFPNAHPFLRFQYPQATPKYVLQGTHGTTQYFLLSNQRLGYPPYAFPWAKNPPIRYQLSPALLELQDSSRLNTPTGYSKAPVKSFIQSPTHYPH